MSSLQVIVASLMSFCLLSNFSALAVQVQCVDLESKNDQTFETIVVDKEPGQYLGHPTTCLLEDGKTMLCVYPKGHGRGPIVYKRSEDGGKTWSERLPTPKSWESSKETPTLHRVVDDRGNKRIIMFSGLYPIRMAYTENDGKTWSELKKIGNFGGIVAMSSVFKDRQKAGKYTALFHDDGRFIAKDAKQQQPTTFTLYKSVSEDGGLTWNSPQAIVASSDKHLCEPGIVRSPDGKQLACLLRENSRRHPSQVIFSDDEGNTWSPPRDLPKWLWGDRHTGQYLDDGRLFIAFRCNWPRGEKHSFQGDWVAWVGSYEDLSSGNPGDLFIRLKDNHKSADCAYPGVEKLPDGSIVTTTYGHWEKGEQPYILAIRIKL